MLDDDLAAGLGGQSAKPPLAGLIAHGRDDIPAAALQLRREPQPQPARCPDDEPGMIFGHHPAPDAPRQAERRTCYSFRFGINRPVLTFFQSPVAMHSARWVWQVD